MACCRRSSIKKKPAKPRPKRDIFSFLSYRKADPHKKLKPKAKPKK